MPALVISYPDLPWHGCMSHWHLPLGRLWALFLTLQIGRYMSPIIDFHIGDAPSPTEAKPTNGGSPFSYKSRGKFSLGVLDKPSSSPKKPMGALSTVSRFACRIDIDRRSPHKARIYAAGFDTRNNIFLGVSLIHTLLALSLTSCL